LRDIGLKKKKKKKKKPPASPAVYFCDPVPRAGLPFAGCR